MVKMGDVWDRTAEFLGDHLGRILPIALLAIVLPNAVTGALQPLQATSGLGLRSLIAILSIGFAVLQLWAQLAITGLVIDPASRGRASQGATARVLPAVCLYLLVVAILLVLALPIGVMMVVGGVDVAALLMGKPNPVAISPAIGGGIAIYSIVLAIAVLFIGARLIPLLPVVAFEKRGFGAIGRSFALTRGLTWKLVGVIILYAVVTIVATLAAQTVFGSLLALIAGGPGPVTLASAVTALIVATVAAGFTVLATVFVAKLYLATTGAPVSDDGGVAFS